MPALIFIWKWNEIVFSNIFLKILERRAADTHLKYCVQSLILLKTLIWMNQYPQYARFQW